MGILHENMIFRRMGCLGMVVETLGTLNLQTLGVAKIFPAQF